MTLYWHKIGPLLMYEKGWLEIHDLNPEIYTNWQMSRWEMFLLGCKAIAASIFSR